MKLKAFVIGAVLLGAALFSRRGGWRWWRRLSKAEWFRLTHPMSKRWRRTNG